MSNDANMLARIMSLVNTTVMLALEKHGEDRERNLEDKRQQYFDDARSVGSADAEAKEWSERMDEWVQALMNIIERGGSAEGGEA